MIPLVKHATAGQTGGRWSNMRPLVKQAAAGQTYMRLLVKQAAAGQTGDCWSNMRQLVKLATAGQTGGRWSNIGARHPVHVAPRGLTRHQCHWSNPPTGQRQVVKSDNWSNPMWHPLESLWRVALSRPPTHVERRRGGWGRGGGEGQMCPRQTHTHARTHTLARPPTPVGAGLAPASAAGRIIMIASRRLQCVS
jgi:hypothetical protein